MNKKGLSKVIVLGIVVLFFFLHRYGIINFSESNEYDLSSVSSYNIEEIQKEYFFRNNDLLEEHYEKHGKEMGFSSKEEYEKAASAVVNNPNSLHKLESEDKDDVYYLEKTNEYVVVSIDGYIRTYFYPDAGKDYYNRQ